MKIATVYKELEIWVLIDDAGDAVVSLDPDDLNDKYEEAVQPLADAKGLRRMKAKVKTPLPTVIEVAADVELEEDAAAAA